MKISKLFHYLYGFLMLLPVFAIGVKCGYVVLNQNAQDNYSGTYRYQESITLRDYNTRNNLSLLDYAVDTHTYHYIESPHFKGHFIYEYNSVYVDGNRYTIFNVSNLVLNGIEYADVKCIAFRTFNGSARAWNISLFTENYQNTYLINNITADSFSYIYFTNNGVDINPTYTFRQYTNKISFDSTQDIIYTNNLSNVLFDYLYLDLFYIDQTLSAVFYASVQELDKVSFFSWARHSFIAEPFLYIGNLFGIPDVHPIFTFLSYWMTISVIWLVFDLFMYVPLLAHRWIDKGMIE